MKQGQIHLSQESLKNLEKILNKMVTSNEEPFSPENFNERKDEFYKKFLPKSDSTHQNFHPLDGLDENFRQLKQVDTTVPPKSFIDIDAKNNFKLFHKKLTKMRHDENIKWSILDKSIQYFILLPNVLKEELLITVKDGFIKINYTENHNIKIISEKLMFKPSDVEYEIKIENSFDIENIIANLRLGVLILDIPYKSVDTENIREIEIL
jgi:HSP20 family molecular chaperone IbpA